MFKCFINEGEGNLIEEQSEIVNKGDSEEGEGGTVAVMIIGNNNVFEVGSVSHSLKIGDSNTLEAKSYVGRGTSLSHGCIIGAGCRLTTDEVLAENTVIYGGQCSRRAAKERPAPQHLQIDFLSKVGCDLINHILQLLTHYLFRCCPTITT